MEADPFSVVYQIFAYSFGGWALVFKGRRESLKIRFGEKELFQDLITFRFLYVQSWDVSLL